MFVPNYNYSNPLNSMQIVDFINFYNPNIINPYIKVLPPNKEEKYARNTGLKISFFFSFIRGAWGKVIV